MTQTKFDGIGFADLVAMKDHCYNKMALLSLKFPNEIGGEEWDRLAKLNEGILIEINARISHFMQTSE